MKQRFLIFDRFRAIGAIIIAIFHLKVAGIISNSNIIKNSYFFIDFFLIFSGFIISHIYLNAINNKKEVFEFLKKRVARLYPLYFFSLLMFIPFAIGGIILNINLGDRFSWDSFFYNLIFLQFILKPNAELTWNIPSWSLNVEFYNYILLAIISSLLVRVKNSYLFYISIIAVIAYLIIKYENNLPNNYLVLLRCTYCYFLGILLNLIYQKTGVIKYSNMIQLISLISILLLFLFYSEEFKAYTLLLPILFLFLVWSFVDESTKTSQFILKIPFLGFIGQRSLSIYLLHSWVISSIKSISIITDKLFNYSFVTINEKNQMIVDFNMGEYNNLIYIPYILIIIFIANLTFKYIEKPCQKFILRTK